MSGFEALRRDIIFPEQPQASIHMRFIFFSFPLLMPSTAILERFSHRFSFEVIIGQIKLDPPYGLITPTFVKVDKISCEWHDENSAVRSLPAMMPKWVPPPQAGTEDMSYTILFTAM